MRCGSVLEAASVAIPVHPPRMPAWQKPVRGLFRRLREHHLAPERLPGRSIARFIGRIADIIFSDTTVGLLLSVVPGLAHLVKGRSGEVRRHVALWALCLILGLFLYGSLPGFLWIGLAIGLHAWIAIQSGALREVLDPVPRAGIVLAMVAVLTVLYGTVPRMAAYGLAGGHTTFTIPAIDVQEGDFLLVRRLGDEAVSRLPRGTLVQFRPTVLYNVHGDARGQGSQTVIGQIVGLPGETIRIADDAYIVDGQPQDPNRLPVPSWLQSRRWVSEISIPPARYFVSTEYTVHGHGQLRLDDGMIKNACVIPAPEIRGRAFMLWWPVWRRGFIE